MNVKEILQRYHVSPLQYDDGVELQESDYVDLYVLLMKYYFVKQRLGSGRVPKIPDNLINKVESHCKRSLLPITEEDCLDILMEQTGGKVLNESIK